MGPFPTPRRRSSPAGGATPSRAVRYSTLAPGARPDDRAALGAPLGDVVFMAGEATSEEFPATVHGALLSGRRAAAQVLERTAADARILVVGAGAAGLGAARVLVDAGREVLVVEARDRIGGRVWTVDDLGAPVDLGAAWIHGPDGNPLTELAEAGGVRLSPTEWDRLRLFGADGVALAPAAADRGLASVERRIGDGAAVVGADASLADALDAGTGGTTGGEPLADWAATVEIEQDLGDDLDALSVRALDEGEELAGGDVLPEGGYAALGGALADGIEIRLDTPVRRIEWGADGVRLIAAGGAIDGDAAVCTLPLGVLRAGAVTFDPPLPATTADAVRALGVGVLDKVALRFPEAFWDPEAHALGLVDDGRETFVSFVSLLPSTGQPILVGLVAGAAARACERRTDAAIVAAAMTALRTMYG